MSETPPELEPEAEVTTTETESDVDGVETRIVDTKFFNQHDGTAGRLPGQYLDEIENKQAEILRAAQEDREPDLDNPGATAGTPLVTEDALSDNSINHREVIDPDAPVASTPVQTLPVDQTGNWPEDNAPANTDLPDAPVAEVPSVTGAATSVGTFNPTAPLVNEAQEDANSADGSSESAPPVVDSSDPVTPEAGV